MKRIIQPLAGICLFTFSLLLGNHLSAQEDGGSSPWKKYVSSPSYGLSMGFMTVDYRDGADNERSETLAMPGIDLRHFNGVNVSEGGGFYYGYELGLGLNFNSGGRSYDVNQNGTNYELESTLAFRFFIMGKHGYRFNLSDDPEGFSLGLELGVGIVAGGSDLDITDTETEGNPSYNSSNSTVSPLLDVGLEGAFQLKEEKRFTTRLGITVSDSFVSTEFGDMGVSGINIESIPVIINLRFGFRMNYSK